MKDVSCASVGVGLAQLLILIFPQLSYSQEKSANVPEPLIENSIEAGEAEVELPKRRFTDWNEYDGPITTLRLGGAILVDAVAYHQDGDSKKQFDLDADDDIRDTRFLLKGQLKTDRKITWTSGVMYDGNVREWFIRETGFMVNVPELWGNIFIGRTKEGFSLSKVMNGYSVWTMERSPINDATVPLLADGVKWLGYIPGYNIIWNIGYFADMVSEGQSFSSYDNQFVSRLAWLPLLSETGGKLLHLGVNLRHGKTDDGQLQMKSRPEMGLAPNFIDTGKFPANHTNMAGWEAYYRRDSVLFGTEYWFESIDSPETSDPLFHGGDVVATWIVTGETRGYNTLGGFFKHVSPAHSVFDGGLGAWELVARESYADLTDGTVEGGKFSRTTLGVNWYLDEILRLEFFYGYGVLDRFGTTGETQFFQGRMQLWL